MQEFNARMSYFGLKTLRSHDEGPHDEPARFHYAPHGQQSSFSLKLQMTIDFKDTNLDSLHR